MVAEERNGAPTIAHDLNTVLNFADLTSPLTTNELTSDSSDANHQFGDQDNKVFLAI